MLAGPLTHQKTPGATFDRIGQEMQGALTASPKVVDKALEQAMLPPLQLDPPMLPENVEPRFDLVANNAPASQVFMALVTDTRYSMLVAPDLSGTGTVNLKNAQCARRSKPCANSTATSSGFREHASIFNPIPCKPACSRSTTWQENGRGRPMYA